MINKTFIHHEFPVLRRLDSEAGRVYETPERQIYPSVTSVVGIHKAAQIADWKARVGVAESVKVSRRAAGRGTAIHSLCEQYLKGTNPVPSLPDVEMFSTLKPILDRIDNIHCLETQMYSDHLKVAGTVDCIAEYEGKLHIIDFKTSGRIKPRDWIHDYFMQTSAYAVMFEELTGIGVPRLLIIIGVDNEAPQIFSEKRNDWIGEFKKLRSQYRLQTGL